MSHEMIPGVYGWHGTRTVTAVLLGALYFIFSGEYSECIKINFFIPLLYSSMYFGSKTHFIFAIVCFTKLQINKQKNIKKGL